MTPPVSPILSLSSGASASHHSQGTSQMATWELGRGRTCRARRELGHRLAALKTGARQVKEGRARSVGPPKRLGTDLCPVFVSLRGQTTSGKKAAGGFGLGLGLAQDGESPSTDVSSSSFSRPALPRPQDCPAPPATEAAGQGRLTIALFQIKTPGHPGVASLHWDL